MGIDERLARLTGQQTLKEMHILARTASRRRIPLAAELRTEHPSIRSYFNNDHHALPPPLTPAKLQDLSRLLELFKSINVLSEGLTCCATQAWLYLLSYKPKPTAMSKMNLPPLTGNPKIDSDPDLDQLNAVESWENYRRGKWSIDNVSEYCQQHLPDLLAEEFFIFPAHPDHAVSSLRIPSTVGYYYSPGTGPLRPPLLLTQCESRNLTFQQPGSKEKLQWQEIVERIVRKTGLTDAFFINILAPKLTQQAIARYKDGQSLPIGNIILALTGTNDQAVDTGLERLISISHQFPNLVAIFLHYLYQQLVDMGLSAEVQVSIGPGLRNNLARIQLTASSSYSPNVLDTYGTPVQILQRIAIDWLWSLGYAPFLTSDQSMEAGTAEARKANEKGTYFVQQSG